MKVDAGQPAKMIGNDRFETGIKAMENLDLKAITETLRKMVVEEQPHPIMIDHARMMMVIWPREELPDWVEALANGNPEQLASVIEVVKADIQEEGKDDH